VRVKPVFKPGDYPGIADEATRSALNELFEQVAPGRKDPEISGEHGGFAVVARNPRLALLLIKLSDYIVREMPATSQRLDRREVAIQTLNMHLKSEYSFQAHIRPAQAAGLTLEQQALLPFWKTANVFNDEQRLVIEYTLGVVTGDVPDELFARLVNQYGEMDAIEFTVGIAWWSFWAMIINATGIDFDFGYGKPGG
jgi:alkylhydroperoxidase family enzyme